MPSNQESSVIDIPRRIPFHRWKQHANEDATESHNHSYDIVGGFDNSFILGNFAKYNQSKEEWEYKFNLLRNLEMAVVKYFRVTEVDVNKFVLPLKLKGETGGCNIDFENASTDALQSEDATCRQVRLVIGGCVEMVKHVSPLTIAVAQRTVRRDLSLDEDLNDAHQDLRHNEQYYNQVRKRLLLTRYYTDTLKEKHIPEKRPKWKQLKENQKKYRDEWPMWTHFCNNETQKKLNEHNESKSKIRKFPFNDCFYYRSAACILKNEEENYISEVLKKKPYEMLIASNAVHAVNSLVLPTVCAYFPHDAVSFMPNKRSPILVRDGWVGVVDVKKGTDNEQFGSFEATSKRGTFGNGGTYLHEVLSKVDVMLRKMLSQLTKTVDTTSGQLWKEVPAPTEQQSSVKVHASHILAEACDLQYNYNEYPTTSYIQHYDPRTLAERLASNPYDSSIPKKIQRNNLSKPFIFAMDLRKQNSSSLDVAHLFCESSDTDDKMQTFFQNYSTGTWHVMQADYVVSKRMGDKNERYFQLHVPSENYDPPSVFLREVNEHLNGSREVCDCDTSPTETVHWEPPSSWDITKVLRYMNKYYQYAFEPNTVDLLGDFTGTDSGRYCSLVGKRAFTSTDNGSSAMIRSGKHFLGIQSVANQQKVLYKDGNQQTHSTQFLQPYIQNTFQNMFQDKTYNPTGNGRRWLVVNSVGYSEKNASVELENSFKNAFGEQYGDIVYGMQTPKEDSVYALHKTGTAHDKKFEEIFRETPNNEITLKMVKGETQFFFRQLPETKFSIEFSEDNNDNNIETKVDIDKDVCSDVKVHAKGDIVNELMRNMKFSAYNCDDSGATRVELTELPDFDFFEKHYKGVEGQNQHSIMPATHNSNSPNSLICNTPCTVTHAYKVNCDGDNWKNWKLIMEHKIPQLDRYDVYHLDNDDYNVAEEIGVEKTKEGMSFKGQEKISKKLEDAMQNKFNMLIKTKRNLFHEPAMKKNHEIPVFPIRIGYLVDSITYKNSSDEQETIHMMDNDDQTKQILNKLKGGRKSLNDLEEDSKIKITNITFVKTTSFIDSLADSNLLHRVTSVTDEIKANVAGISKGLMRLKNSYFEHIENQIKLLGATVESVDSPAGNVKLPTVKGGSRATRKPKQECKEFLKDERTENSLKTQESFLLRRLARAGNKPKKKNYYRQKRLSLVLFSMEDKLNEAWESVNKLIGLKQQPTTDANSKEIQKKLIYLMNKLNTPDLGAGANEDPFFDMVYTELEQSDVEIDLQNIIDEGALQVLMQS